MNQEPDFNLSPNNLEVLLSNLKKSGEKIIDLTSSNPTVLGFDYSGLKIPMLFSTEKNLIYSPDPKGSAAARDAIGKYYKARNNYFKFKSISDLILASGTSECYSYILKAFGSAGEEVLLPAPGYPLLEHLVSFEKLNPVHYNLKYDNDKWAIDPEELEKSVSAKTKFIIIVSPNNPTGHTLGKDEFIYIDKLCSKNGINIIIDEVFFDYINENNYEPFLPEYPENYSIFILNGISKITATPQLKLSWLYVISKESVTEKLEFIADAYLSVNTPVQNALPYLLENKNVIQPQIISRIKNNLEFLKNSGLDYYKVNAGWYACLKTAGNITDDAFCYNLLEKYSVLAHPGFFYEFNSENVIVISLIVRESDFIEGIEKIKLLLMSR